MINSSTQSHHPVIKPVTSHPQCVMQHD